MAVTAKCLLEAKYAENSETTQYTAGAGVRTIVDKFTATNVSAGAAALTVKLVASGDTASTEETIIKEKSLAAGETYTFPEVVGQVLNAGDFVSTLAGTASAIVIRMSGRENT
jgi:hypothetical protein